MLSARVSIDLLSSPLEPGRQCSGGSRLPACVRAEQRLSVAHVGVFSKVKDCGFLDKARFRLAVARFFLGGDLRFSGEALFEQGRSLVVCGSAGKDCCGWTMAIGKTPGGGESCSLLAVVQGSVSSTKGGNWSRLCNVGGLEEKGRVKLMEILEKEGRGFEFFGSVRILSEKKGLMVGVAREKRFEN
ncbi:30S ribosomal protein S13 [Striga asiatica]|uniref:30S ribosomal protein S13 n=1 Tax=Striga asiatica TaxID=4170 RepID=A0A5A7R236_STRAF|nr:30S ribosomal protein S13 [Striga asiatica]